MKYLAGLLDEIGVGGDRVRMVNLSSAEGSRFAEVCEEMTQDIMALGPSPLNRERSGAGGQVSATAEAIGAEGR